MTTKSEREQILAELLETITEREKMKESEIKKEEVLCTGMNYTAAIYLITVRSEGRDDLELFAKVVKANDVERKVMQIPEMYERERFIYEVIANIYADLQDKFDVKEEYRYRFPKYYLCSSTPKREAMIFANLAPKGFFSPDRFGTMDWEYASKSVYELAKFHALSYVFENMDPDLFNEIVKPKKEFVHTNYRPDAELWSKYIVERISKASEGLTEENAKRFAEFVKKNDISEQHLAQYEPQSRSCLTHGDFKHTNIMTRYEDGNLSDVFLVDYQQIQYGSGVNDLIFFLFTGSDETFRDQHYSALINHYYESLTKVLDQYSMDITSVYPREEFDQNLRERSIYGLYIGIMILPYVLADGKPDFNKTVDELKIGSGSEYNQRFNGIINTFVKWGYL